MRPKSKSKSVNNNNNVLVKLEPQENTRYAQLYNAMENAKLSALAHARMFDEYGEELMEKYNLPTAFDVNFATGEVIERSEVGNG